MKCFSCGADACASISKPADKRVGYMRTKYFCRECYFDALERRGVIVIRRRKLDGELE